MKYSAKLVGYTQSVIGIPASGPEALVAYCARVSNPSNQDNPDYKKLLEYCIRNKHWSIFQIVNAVIEIKAPRDITRQFTRHSSLYCAGDPFETPGFNFDYGGVQEFSQRYSDEIDFTDRDFRRQDNKNRQNSIDDLDEEVVNMSISQMEALLDYVKDSYEAMRKGDVAKECARVILPEGLTMSTLYVNGTLRSWLTYLEVRDDPHVTQHEHVLLAQAIREALLPIFPTVLKKDNE
jgi:thymidylate synthase (FAD)